MWERATVQELTGERLHLQHGPIDVVLKGFGTAEAVAGAYAAARGRFPSVLGELTEEIIELRKPMESGPRVTGPVARRMVEACRPYAGVFVTPMAAVAGAVADELLAAMLAAAPLARAYVNDGGDIAVHLAPGERIAIGVAADFSRGAVPAMSGALELGAGDGIGGIATSGRYGRSFSLGIADSVTVLARDAASADVAATLVANAVDVASPAVMRRPARELDPDSDLGELLVTVEVGALSEAEIEGALGNGGRRAEDYLRRGLIAAAAMMLAGRTEVVGLNERGARPLGFRETHG
jgi:ApbE superfamily uncharacterized protein (UPF0280 family)